MHRPRSSAVALLILAAATSLAACGNWSRVGRYSDPELELPLHYAVRSIGLAATPFRMRRGVEVICMGPIWRVGPADEERREAVLARNERMAEMLMGAAPEVVPAQACIQDETRGYRLEADGRPALSLNVELSEIVNDRISAYVDLRFRGNQVGGGAITIRLVRDDEGWWLDEFFCRDTLACPELDQTKILEGIRFDGRSLNSYAPGAR